MQDYHIVWAVVAMAAIKMVGDIVAMIIRGHYHIIETPTKMASTEIKTTCREIEDKTAGKIVEQVIKNSEAIGKLKCQVENGGKHETPTNH